jgi:hypothetical protein
MQWYNSGVQSVVSGYNLRPVYSPQWGNSNAFVTQPSTLTFRNVMRCR